MTTFLVSKIEPPLEFEKSRSGYFLRIYH